MTENAYPRVPEHVHWRRFDEEIVIVDLTGRRYFGLTDVASDAFERLAAGHPLDQVVDELLKVYDVERSQLETDLEGLVRGLVEHGLFVLQTGT